MLKTIVLFQLFLYSFIFAVGIPIAVNDLKGNGLSSSEVAIISDRLRLELFQTGAYIVMERGEMNTILQEMEFQNSGACDEASCMVEVGQLLGVSKIVAGSIGKIGNFYTISLRLIDVQSGKLEGSATHDYKGDISGLISNGISVVAKKLAEGKSSSVDISTLPTDKPIDTVRYSKVKIESLPLGASVKVDNKILGETPLVTTLSYGHYTINLSKSGYKEHNSRINVNDSVMFDNYTLTPITLKIESSSKDKRDKRGGQITRWISVTVGFGALGIGLLLNSEIDNSAATAQTLYDQAIMINDGKPYNNAYVSTLSDIESKTVFRNVMYGVSGASFTLFAISFAF